MKPLTWQQRFGAKRRATDRALLAECEKQISAADLRDIELEVERQERERAREERRRIAAAFGRPL